VASSVRDLSEFLKKSDERKVQIQPQSLRFQEQSNRLRMYETLLLRESYTASQDERQFVESQMRSIFFASLFDDINTSLDASAPAVIGIMTLTPLYLSLHT
jgi:hypothetical protein